MQPQRKAAAAHIRFDKRRASCPNPLGDSPPPDRKADPMADTAQKQPQDYLETLLNAYSHHYDISRDVKVEGGFFPAAAFYYLRDEHYLIRRDKTFYATEQHDYTYFYLTNHLDLETLQTQIDLSLKAGLAEIKPHKEHMCSFVTLVILADTIDPEAKKLLKKTRFRKNYWLALHGWMEYHIAAMECSTQSFFSNPAGREVRRTLENNFAPRAK